MGRQPFISIDLRPDLAVQSDPTQPTLTGDATTAQLAEAARALLSDEERQQIERGRRDEHREFMQTVPQPSPNVQGTTLEGETVLLDLSTGRITRSTVWGPLSGSIVPAISLYKTFTRRFARGSKPRRNALLTIFSLS